MTKGGIPEGWLDCPRKSLLIDKLFVAMKTPLSSRYSDRLPEAASWTPQNFFEWMNILRLRIGLWVDLTNTDRYYDRQEVLDEGIEYKKLRLLGHGVPPKGSEVQEFIKMVDNFVHSRRQKGKKIVVHCTHGFNRTGFLIVSYLVEKCRYKVLDAIAEFAECRPPGIYRQTYVDKLVQLYSPRAVPPVVTDPEWVQVKNKRKRENSHRGPATPKRASKAPATAGSSCEKPEMRAVLEDPLESPAQKKPVEEEPERSPTQNSLEEQEPLKSPAQKNSEEEEVPAQESSENIDDFLLSIAD